MGKIPSFGERRLHEVIDAEVGQHVEVDVKTTDGIISVYNTEMRTQVDALLVRLGYFEEGPEAHNLRLLMQASAGIAVGKLLSKNSFEISYGDWNEPTAVINVTLRDTQVQEATVTQIGGTEALNG